MEVNPHGSFIAWLIQYYRKRGMTPEEAQSKAITLGLAMHRRLVTVESVYRQLFMMVQAEEAQQSTTV